MTRLLLALPLIALAACNQEPDIKMENASVADVAREMRKEGTDSFVDPGKWQQTVSVLEIDAPGMPENIRAGMRQAMAKPQVHEVCLSPEEAKSPKEDFFTGADQNCRYEHFNWGDGKIDLKLNCKHPNATQSMTMVGTYSAKAYSMTMTATNQGSQPIEQMVMKMKVDAKRVGECDGQEKMQVGN